MKAIGLDRPTRELGGLDRTTTANGTTRVTGREIAVVLSTIIAGTMITTEIMTGTTTNTVSTNTTINSDATAVRLRTYPTMADQLVLTPELLNHGQFQSCLCQ